MFPIRKLVFPGTHSPFPQQGALYEPEQNHLLARPAPGWLKDRGFVGGLVRLNSLDAIFLELNYLFHITLKRHSERQWPEVASWSSREEAPLVSPTSSRSPARPWEERVKSALGRSRGPCPQEQEPRERPACLPVRTIFECLIRSMKKYAHSNHGTLSVFKIIVTTSFCDTGIPLLSR